jgi:hypothetical protein
MPGTPVDHRSVLETDEMPRRAERHGIVEKPVRGHSCGEIYDRLQA